MEDIKKELADLKELLSKLLEIQTIEYGIKYGFLNQSKTNSNLKN